MREAILDTPLSDLALPGIAIATRPVTRECVPLLLPEERASLLGAGPAALARSAAARSAARDAFAKLGFPQLPVRRAANRAPAWPAGLIGSLAHTDELAIAVVARADVALGLGIDIEPDEPLDGDVAEIVATPGERSRYAAALLRSRTFFVVKEAVFKAVHPIDGIFLEHADVDVDLDRGLATLSYGRAVPFRLSRDCGHIAALAIVA